MRTIGFILLWLAGSGAAIGVAWSGVTVVDNEIIDPAPAAEFRSPAQENASPLGATPLVDDDSTSDADKNRAVETDVPDPQQATTTAVESSSTARATSTPTQRASTPTQRAPTPTQPASTPSPTQPPTSTASSSTTTPPPTVAAGQTLTFSLIGGSTAISFSPSGVQVLWATPKPGFEVKIENESPGIKVEFRADNHRSRIDAWWSAGPQHSIREEPD